MGNVGSIGDINGEAALLSTAQLRAIMPGARVADIQRYLPALNKYLPLYDMTTPERIGAYLGQIAVESNNLRSTSESLYYKTPGRLHSNWPSLFPQLEDETPYLRNPEKLANYVYANKYGNGPKETGDGWLYRGGGVLQITFKNNYRDIGNDLGLDLVATPDLVRNNPTVAVRASLQYWKNNGLNQYADRGNYQSLTRRINTKMLDYDRRVAITQNALRVLRNQ